MLTAAVSMDERSANAAVDANDRASLRKQTETPWQNDNDSSDETTDIDGTDNGLDDLSADNSPGNDPNSLDLCLVDLSVLAPRKTTSARALVLPVHSFFCLHKHIQERAPPELA